MTNTIGGGPQIIYMGPPGGFQNFPFFGKMGILTGRTSRNVTVFHHKFSGYSTLVTTIIHVGYVSIMRGEKKLIVIFSPYSLILDFDPYL